MCGIEELRDPENQFFLRSVSIVDGECCRREAVKVRIMDDHERPGATIWVPRGIKTITVSPAIREEIDYLIFQENSDIARLVDIAFMHLSIQVVFIPNSVMEIGDQCFMYCRKLRKVLFGEDSRLQKIGRNAFSWSKVDHLDLPIGVSEVFGSSFVGIPEISVHPNSNHLLLSPNGWLFDLNKTVLIRNFSHHSSIQIPAFVRELSEGAFEDSVELTDLSFDTGSVLTFIPDRAFHGCYNLESVRLPACIEIIGKGAFGWSRDLRTFDIENGSKLREIRSFAIDSMELQKIVLPRRVVLGECAIRFCPDVSFRDEPGQL
jgi:hypothetical protein